MKIRVQRGDGAIEVLDLSEPITFYVDYKPMWHLSDGNGTDHYFTEEGYYDGWGKAVAHRNLTTDEADDLVSEVEQRRIVEEQ